MAINENYLKDDAIYLVATLEDTIGEESFQHITHLATDKKFSPMVSAIAKQFARKGRPIDIIMLENGMTDENLSYRDSVVLFFEEINDGQAVDEIAHHLHSKKCGVSLCILCWENLLDEEFISGRKIVSI